ncbi:MAG TPA: glycoside hydrolase family 32 protein [Puia sp.]|nr:glycoside hydrolase family 32 protein [Puia sp.]
MKKQLLTCILSFSYLVTVLAQGGQMQTSTPTPTPQWRPLYHFTPLKNWTNDPNGLIYIKGVYHLYNQQNPFENKWGHMSWGHAVSKDLVHWEHLPIAIPEKIDKDTTWIFSGCAVWDGKNSSGFCKGGGCIVAIYTADQPNLKKESQFIAYSNDGGMTYTNYSGNPVIDLQKKDFRDPNVTWNDELKKWVMVVVLPTEHTARFYASDNLKEWALLSEFGNAGYTEAAWECPALIQLPVEGNPGKKKWALLISAGGPRKGPFMQYFVGDFTKGVFKNDNAADTMLTVDDGDCFYAAIPWNNLPGNQKILIGWMVPGSQETFPWKGQMSIPRDLSLRETREGLRLVQQPAALVKGKLGDFAGGPVTELTLRDGEEKALDEKVVGGGSYWLEAELDAGQGAVAGFRIARSKGGSADSLLQTEIGYDAVKQEVYVDRSHTGDEKIRKDHLRQTVRVPGGSSKVKLEILFDKSSLEVFVNGGEKVITTYVFAPVGANGVTAFASGGSVKIKSLKVRDLSGSISR